VPRHYDLRCVAMREGVRRVVALVPRWGDGGNVHCEYGGGRNLRARMCGWDILARGRQVCRTRVSHPGPVRPLSGGELLPRGISAGDMPRAHVLSRGRVHAHPLPGGVLESSRVHSKKGLCGLSRRELLPDPIDHACVRVRGRVLP